ncbi:DC-STAMP domain-containing protein 2 [Cyclopterus lumpus]|uniref:DC-STAMP domain-containing protein 2 n=1 Tax=Cyclopterus lumpus TaxID=8103 RepID=UPI001486CF5C|nr:DC-STAMP domain-containing protein 2 [Cyclopterus lumpus]
MKSDVIVQVKRGGVRKTIRGVLKRSAGRSDLGGWLKVKGHLLEAVWSLAAFVGGLLLASLFGVAALFLQKQPPWSCAYATLTVAVPAAFGMGLSAGIRADVSVLLPSLCSAKGKKFLLFLFVSVLLAGPLNNTLENTERAAASMMCGAELAANQTQELMQKAATPLFSALSSIREISSNARAAAGRVHHFIRALTDSVRHVARTLRNVLHFLVDIGDMCNATLGSPYRKCRAVFAEARADCSGLLGELDFLCDIVDAFLPLCSLARAGELFCIIPSYIASHLKKRLAAPAVAAFDRMKRQFDFNLSATVTFDLDTNSSRSLQQVAQDIMEEVSSELHVFQKLSDPLTYGGLVLLAWSFLRAVRYRRRYLRELDFDNVYISAQFKELNQQVTSGGGASVLPITRREAKTYIRPLSCHLTSGERRAVLRGVVSVLRHLVMGGLLVALDFLVFWMLDQVHHQVKGDVVARAPVTVAVQVNGSGYASDIFRDVVASFNVLQRGNVTVVSRKCLMEPSEPDRDTCFTLGFLLGLALLVSLTGGFMQRCRRLVCAAYHPERELERIQFLRQKILDQRTTVWRALRRSAARSPGGGGGGGGLPGGAHLAHLLGGPSVSCLSCGEEVRQEDDMVTCDVPQCPGVFCGLCFHALGNRCVVCTRPLTFQQEEELDSSEDEQPNSNRKLCTPRAGAGSDISVDSDSELSEADMAYQNQPGSDDSDSSPRTSGMRDRTPQAVIIA